MEKVYIDNEFVKEEISKEWKGKNGKYHNDIEIRVDKEFYDEESAYKITEEMVQDYIVVRELVQIILRTMVGRPLNLLMAELYVVSMLRIVK